MLHDKIPVWPEHEQDSGEESEKATPTPTLYTYVLEGSEARPAVMVLPGGGYGFTSTRESEAVAIQFAAAGFHSFVLHYSCAPKRHPQPLLDVSRAMCILRENAEDWGIKPDKIAVCGFSAGGHLAATLGVHWDKSFATEGPGIQRGQNAPNALVLAYPVISAKTRPHQTSFRNLLGKNATEEQLHTVSVEHHVTSETVPVFLWHTAEDTVAPVDHSLLLASALAEKAVPFELHVYPYGGHGLSLADKETNGPEHADPHVATWFSLCTDWLSRLFS